MELNCKSCRYWDEDGNLPAYGLCRRSAPAAAVINPLEGTNSVDAVWPRTARTDWCGQWTSGELE
jgi:hypothetical protein